MKKYILSILTISLLNGCFQPNSGSIISEQPLENKKIESHHKVDSNGKFIVFGNATGYKKISIKLERNSVVIDNISLSVDSKGYYETHIDDVRSDDKLCIEDSGCFSL
ncbi:MAG: hypothetical protein ACK4IX_01530 [Candidatus Sericytochromatia bacterium]